MNKCGKRTGGRNAQFFFTVSSWCSDCLSQSEKHDNNTGECQCQIENFLPSMLSRCFIVKERREDQAER
jgi:hypothetical protein